MSWLFRRHFHQLPEEIQNFGANLAVVFGQQSPLGGIVEIRVTKQDAVLPGFSLLVRDGLRFGGGVHILVM